MVSFVVSLIAAAAATGALIPVLHRLEVMDLPNHRSSHRVAIPRGGGIGLFVGVGAGLAVATPGREAWVIFSVALVAGAVGLVDDLRGMAATRRLAIQVILCGVLSLYLSHSGVLGGLTAWALTAAGTVWLVGYLNAYNFMDGINGISPLSAAVAGGWYAWLGHETGGDTLVFVGIVIAGAGLGFLPWNAPRAKVFLGDVGSYAVGVLIGGLALLAFAQGATLVESLAPLTLYLADTAWALAKRVRRGDSWREAHREHVYQRVADLGFGHLATSASVTAGAGVACFLAWVLAAWLAAPAMLLLCASYLGSPRVLAARHRAISAGHSHN